ncbi:hypothetical protein OHT59_08515 [Streptomyces sp. NBC_00243]|uniref:hypothetical protein n=1 Tax=Streptomyces sp. NBC_00243 TaxID=2975688 RepID=UPI002DDAFF75|nr:hypothetical protein [Streptomyces sp. NBC_00243]WRZ18530.1 hypothetical protein OHT59_08515 [Streptomyces sp. NBC_00243]
MTTLQLRPRTTVRAAGLVDVPAVVRLIAPSPPPPSRSVPDPVQECSTLDWEQTQSAMRLVLAHHALEEGQVWVAEREDGTLLAAAVWLPPGAGSEPPDTRFSSLFSRELATRPQERPVLPTGLKGAWPDGPHWKVVVVGALDDTSAWDHTVAADLLAPGLRAVDSQSATAVAVTTSARHGDQLRPLGFRRPREVRSMPGASAWLTTRQPQGRAGG